MAKIEAVKEAPPPSSSETTFHPMPEYANRDTVSFISADSNYPMSESLTPATEIVTKQPGMKEELKLGPLTPLAEVTRARDNAFPGPNSYRPPRRSMRRRRCSVRWNRILQWTYVVLVIIWRIFLCLGALAGVALLFGLSFGTTAANGAIWMLIGNAILRAAHLPGYVESNKVPAAIGAAGCIFASICVGIVTSFLPRTSTNRETGKPEHAWWIRPPAMVCVGALTGPIGVSILKRHHYDLQGMDVLHAARAGALGATIIFPGLTFVVGLIFAPLWIAMLMGLEFIYAKSNETISSDGCHKYSYCLVYGSCRDDPDPEIQEQLDRSNAVRHRMGANGESDW